MYWVDLDDHVGTGLIFPAATGVKYRHWAGGPAHLLRQQQGFLVPFGNDSTLDHQLISMENELFNALRSEGQCFDDENADRLDSLLQAWHPTFDLVTDRTRLSDSYEGWVHILVNRGDSALLVLGIDLPTAAILIWRNTR